LSGSVNQVEHGLWPSKWSIYRNRQLERAKLLQLAQFEHPADQLRSLKGKLATEVTAPWLSQQLRVIAGDLQEYQSVTRIPVPIAMPGADIPTHSELTNPHKRHDLQICAIAVATEDY
jgi:hypothetical protein